MMKHLRAALPFFLAVLLLTMAIAIPIFLSTAQDEALLHKVKTETLPTGSRPQEEEGSMLERLELLGGGKKVVAMGVTTHVEAGLDGAVTLEDKDAKQVLKELEKLQSLGGFPDFDLRRKLKCNDDALRNVTYFSDQGEQVTVFIMSFSASEAEFSVWVDADTYTIYQYNVEAYKDSPMTVDKASVAKGFTDYLSISTEQFNSLYTFTDEGYIGMFLKDYAPQYN